MKDTVFNKKIDKQFEFDEKVATVFDDMISRSIPYYHLNIDLIVNTIDKLAKRDDIVLDIGCSTASTLLEISKKRDDLKLLGIDNSDAMIKVAKKKIMAYGVDIQIENMDVLSDKLPKADIILANYLFQFIRPFDRENVVKKINGALNSDGFMIVSEKIVFENKKLSKTMIDIYHEYKKLQGYSDFEIMQKREALENILIPYTNDENIKLFKKCGFKGVEILFQWANFTTYFLYN